MTVALQAPFVLVDRDATTSTNDDAMALADDGAPAWTIVRAVSQSAGRGRRGKSFASPPGNSYTSFILRPQGSPERVAQLALVAGLAVADAIAALAPGLPAPRCKWPNDVLVDGYKVCGILVEAASSGERIDHVIVGIGINLVSHPEIEGHRIGDLAGLGAGLIERDAMLVVLSRSLHERVETWQAVGFTALREAWVARAAGLGRPVRVEDGNRTLRGELVDIDGEGALLLAETPAIRHRIVSGSLFLEEAA